MHVTVKLGGSRSTHGIPAQPETSLLACNSVASFPENRPRLSLLQAIISRSLGLEVRIFAFQLKRQLVQRRVFAAEICTDADGGAATMVQRFDDALRGH